MKFSGNVLNGMRNKWLDFGSDLDHFLEHPDVFVYNIAQKLMDGFWWNFQDMSEKVKGWNGWILEVIRITIWIFWIHQISKSYRWIVMTFSANDLNGTRNKWLHFWSDLDHCLDHLDPGCNIILGWILMIFLGYVTNGKRKKW